MTNPTCPVCGDGMECVGTLNHIECVEKVMAERDAALERAKSLEYGIEKVREDSDHAGWVFDCAKDGE